MIKHLKRFVAITISLVMAFQFSTNDLYTYAQTEDVVEPTQTEVSTESDSTATEQPVEPSETVEGAADTTTPPETGTDTTEPAPDTGTTPETQPAEPQQEVAGTLKVEFVDANNATVKESVEQALTSKYVGDTIRLEDLSIETNIEGYTLTEVKDKNDNTQVYTTETKDFVLTGNVTELQFVYTQNVQTDQPEESEDSNAQQGGQEDSDSTQEQEEADEEDSDSQADKEDESKEETKDEELAYPEQILSVTASDGAIITIIAKEGALPEGAEVVAEPVESDSIAQIVEDALSQEGKELQSYKAYNITILLDGEEIQPELSIQVGITGSGISGTDKSLFHIADGSSTAEKVSAIDTGNTQTFSAEGFSIYIIAGNNESGNGSSEDMYEMNIDDKITLEEKKLVFGGDWSIDDESVVKIIEESPGSFRKNPTATIQATGSGRAVVTYKEKKLFGESKESKFYIEVLDNDGEYTVRFNSNGGSGDVPESITVFETGKTVVLPNPENMSKEGYKFVGWSESKDGGKITSGGNAGYQTVYSAGGNYTITKDTILYAIWAQTDGDLNDRLWIAIRDDGIVPSEPANQDTGSYTFIGRFNGSDRSETNILTYVSPAQTAVGYENVIQLLTPQFYAYVQQNAKINWDTQYIEWYVIKYETMSGTRGWHIDGVIREKEDYYVDYSPNATGYTGLWPNGMEYEINSRVLVEKAGRLENGIWKPLQLAGYDFVGWNTKPDGSGESFKPGDSFELTREFVDANHVEEKDNTVTLYAQWKAKDKITINYKVNDEKMGSVDPVQESLAPATGKAQGSTATAKDGYAFVNWTDEEGKVVSWDAKYVPAKVGGVNVAATYTANFAEDKNDDDIPDPYQMTITYKVVNGQWNDETSADKTETVTLMTDGHYDENGTANLANVPGVGEKPAAGYEAGSWDNEPSTETVINKDSETIFTYTYAEKGDVTIDYKVNDEKMGSVDPVQESLAPATGKAQGSTATAKDGYAFVNWTDEEGKVVSWDAKYVPAKVGGVNVAATYTANFEKDVYTLTINYLDDAGNSIENSYINNIRYMDPYSVNSPSVSNFALIDISQSVITGNMPSNDVVVNVYYSADTHSTDPNNPDTSDGVPDKYQARIEYTVTNGAFDFGYTYVTLFDEDGNWSETGKGTLDATQIPTATANAGYDQNSFAWQGNTPVAGYEITGDTTFNATFNAIPVTPAPTTPGGDDATAPTATPVVARTTDDGTTTDEPEVEEVEDDETPLSDGEVEEVEDNATPKSNDSIWALINLIAAIVTVILGLFLLLSKRHRNDEDEDEDERQARMARGEEKEQEQKRGWICKVLGVVVAIVSVVFFILTEDMSLPMALTDKWTIWMIVIAIIELVLVLVGRRWKDVDDDEEQQA